MLVWRGFAKSVPGTRVPGSGVLGSVDEQVLTPNLTEIYIIFFVVVFFFVGLLVWRRFAKPVPGFLGSRGVLKLVDGQRVI